ncbi:hypothetical protein Droror1_Dr00015354 [Drosera rotundifolia]
MKTSRITTSLPFIILVAGLLLATRDVLRALDRDHGDDDDNTIKVMAEDLEILPLVGAVGPESIAFDPDGRGPYVGVSDGRIVRWDRDRLRWVDFAVTSPNRRFLEATVTGDDTGTLMKYDPTTKETTTLLSNLTFANGVSVSKNGVFVLALESTRCRVNKYWLKTSKAGTSEVVTQLPGFPDNIRMNLKGEFWVGIYSRRSKFLEWILSFRRLGNIFVRLPFEPLKLVSSFISRKSVGMAVKLSEEGDVVLQVLEEKSGKLRFVSEVMENEGDLWFGSVVMPFVSVFRNHTVT